jgi:uncharacterized protein YuzE
MRFTYDPDADAAYFYVADDIPPGGVAKTYCCDPGKAGGMINLDFDGSGRLLGVEVLDASALLPPHVLESDGSGGDASGD